MIFIVLAALFWGITNPFLQNGAEGLEKEEKLIGKFMKMISNWKFLCPFLINQCGSIMYYLSMGQYPISIAVTMVNALTLVVTTLTSYAIGESKLSFDEFIGMTLVLSGIIL